ncbi:MAG: DUF6429 family protein [Kiritimatiellia bacterium]
MDYDKDKVDEATLALLVLGLSRTPTGGRAWKAFDLQTLERLHRKGWLAAPRIKDISVELTPAGAAKAEELFRKFFQS